MNIKKMENKYFARIIVISNIITLILFFCMALALKDRVNSLETDMDYINNQVIENYHDFELQTEKQQYTNGYFSRQLSNYSNSINNLFDDLYDSLINSGSKNVYVCSITLS